MIRKWNIVLFVAFFAFSLVSCKAEKVEQKSIEKEDSLSSTNSKVEAQDYQPGEWLVNYSQALELAEEYKKPILINFTGSDWCIWCKRLSKEVFSEKDFIDYARENLILLKLDFPKSIQQSSEEKRQNESLANQFGIQGFPTILILDSKGKEIARTGYQPGGSEQYVKHLRSLIK